MKMELMKKKLETGTEEQKKLTHLRFVHNEKLDNMKRVKENVMGLKKETAGFKWEEKDVGENVVDILRVKHQQKIQEVEFEKQKQDFKMNRIKQENRELEADVKQQKCEMHSLHTHLDYLMFRSARINTDLCTWKEKEEIR